MRKTVTSSSLNRCIVVFTFLLCIVIVVQSYYVMKSNNDYYTKNIKVLEGLMTPPNVSFQTISMFRPLSEHVPSSATKIETSVPQSTSAPKEVLDLDLNKEHLRKWHASIRFTMSCILKKNGGLFFYHTRKAAGTTIRDWLTEISFQYHLNLFESEGLSLNRGLIDLKNMLSFTAIRHPIDRILSLYWYEHVAWWIDVKHENEKVKPLHEWVAGWSDESPFKQKMVRANPGLYSPAYFWLSNS
jgi:hypothetical protein